MARRRWYRRSARVVYPKKKWASNIRPGTLGGSDNPDAIALVTNSTQSSTPTPVIIKAGNFKIQGDVSLRSIQEGLISGAVNMFVIYAPEGIGITASELNGAIIAHPEWVMGWTTVDTGVIPTTSVNYAGNKFSITSRLKRNLNSGDRIILFCQYTSGLVVTCNYIAQWYTCSN